MIELTDEVVAQIKRGGKPPFTIKDLAAAQGVSLVQYAEQHGINPRTLSDWSCGRIEPKSYLLLSLYFWDRYEQLKTEHEKLLKLLSITAQK